MAMVGLVALVFSDCPLSLREYVKRRFESEGLTVEMETDEDLEGRIVAEVNGKPEVFAERAEKIALGKRRKSGEVTPFKVAQTDAFVGSDDDTVFSEAEKVMLLWQIVHEILADENEFEDVEEKETLVDWLHRNGHIEDCFPIHNGATVAGFLRDMSIRKPWMSDELIERMRDYFGDRVALYFAFISLYTTCLLTYAGVGIVVFVLGLVPAIRPLVSLIFAVFSSFWSTYMLQSWYQRNIKLIYDWRGIVLGDGTDEKVFEKRLVEDVRAEFQGELKKDEITGELRPTASKEDTSRRFVISYTMISVFFLLAARTIFACFSFEDRMNAWLADEDDEYVFLKVFPLTLVFQNIPMVVFIVTMMILDKLYGSIASKLTNYENHLLKREYALNLTRKLTVFQFLNTFGVFLYIAFIRKDVTVLKGRITNLFIVELIVGNVKETLIPILQRAYAKIQKQDADAKHKKTDSDKPTQDIATGGDEEPVTGAEAEQTVETVKDKIKKFTSKPFLKQMWSNSKDEIIVTGDNVVKEFSVRDQLELEEAEDNVDDDYFEMYRQLGIVTLFAVVTPLAPLLAAVNNCVEIYTDFLKMVRNSKRPIPSREISIGAWYDAMQTLSLLSFMTNLLLVFHTTDDGSLLFSLKATDLYLLMVFMEHVMLTVRAAYVSSTSSTPESISVTRAKRAFRSAIS